MISEGGLYRRSARKYNPVELARRRRDEEWFYQLGTEFQRLSAHVRLSFGATGISRRSWCPNVDLVETEDALVLTAELAGVDPESVVLHYVPDRHSIVIRGNRMPPGGANSCRCHQLEVLFGEFEREVALPDVSVDREGIRGSSSHGMLIVSIPKKVEEVTRRTIPVTENGGDRP